jgi:hypothetical protein
LPDAKEGKMTPTATAERSLSIEGYDRLDLDDLDEQLRQSSQIELAEIDDYERAHQDRRPVLDKLRYLRSTEPLKGYDGLDAGAILDALHDADIAKLHGVRGYEAKLRQREEVLDGVTHLRETLRAQRTPDTDEGAAPKEPSYAPARGLKAAVANFGMIAIVIVAGALFLAALLIGGFVVLTVIAPDLVS